MNLYFCTERWEIRDWRPCISCTSASSHVCHFPHRNTDRLFTLDKTCLTRYSLGSFMSTIICDFPRHETWRLSLSDIWPYVACQKRILFLFTVRNVSRSSCIHTFGFTMTAELNIVHCECSYAGAVCVPELMNTSSRGSLMMKLYKEMIEDLPKIHFKENM